MRALRIAPCRAALAARLVAAAVAVTSAAGAQPPSPSLRAPPQTAAPAPGPAPGKEQAKKLFEEGVDLEKRADYAGALARFTAAEHITATPGVRFHKGYCLEMTGKIAAAVTAYEAADETARELKKQDVHAAIVARLDPLRARVPQMVLRLATPATAAEVQVDGAVVPALHLGGTAFRIEPGEHALTARAEGFRPWSRRLLVPEAVTTSVDIVLDPVVPPSGAEAVAATRAPGAADTGLTPDAPPSARSAAVPPGRSIALPLMTNAGTVALAAGGVVLIVLAGAAQEDGETACPRKRSCESERSQVRTLDALALGSFVAATGLGVLSVALWSARPPERTASVDRAPVARTRLVAKPSLLGLEGTF